MSVWVLLGHVKHEHDEILAVWPGDWNVAKVMNMLANCTPRSEFDRYDSLEAQSWEVTSAAEGDFARIQLSVPIRPG